MRTYLPIALSTLVLGACGQSDSTAVDGAKGLGGAVGGLPAAKTESVESPRDAASGLPTGKRQHKPVNVTSPRDAASGLPTGKRQHKPVNVTSPSAQPSAASHEVESPRDAASGLPTDK